MRSVFGEFSADENVRWKQLKKEARGTLKRNNNKKRKKRHKEWLATRTQLTCHLCQ